MWAAICGASSTLRATPALLLLVARAKPALYLRRFAANRSDQSRTVGGPRDNTYNSFTRNVYDPLGNLLYRYDPLEN